MIQSALANATRSLREEIQVQAGIALASLERATGQFQALHVALGMLPGSAEFAKQIQYLRDQQTELRKLLEHAADLFQMPHETVTVKPVALDSIPHRSI